MTPEVREGLRAVYAEADRLVAEAGPRCDASGRCCRFREYGHTLFVSGIEAELLLETAPPYSTPVTDAGCPFQVDGLCTARADRPLGCRVYFCDPTYQETGAAISEEMLRRIKRVADRAGLGWEYAPFHRFLNEARQATVVESTNPASRLHLTVID